MIACTVIAGLLYCYPVQHPTSEELRARPCGVECQPGWCADFTRPWPEAPTPAPYPFYRCDR